MEDVAGVAVRLRVLGDEAEVAVVARVEGTERDVLQLVEVVLARPATVL